MSRAELLKSLIKGTDISEDAALDKYLLSRGINPKFATKDQKVAHSKTSQFINWKNSRLNEMTDKNKIRWFPTVVNHQVAGMKVKSPIRRSYNARPPKMFDSFSQYLHSIVK